MATIKYTLSALFERLGDAYRLGQSGVASYSNEHFVENETLDQFAMWKCGCVANALTERTSSRWQVRFCTHHLPN